MTSLTRSCKRLMLPIRCFEINARRKAELLGSRSCEGRLRIGFAATHAGSAALCRRQLKTEQGAPPDDQFSVSVDTLARKTPRNARITGALVQPDKGDLRIEPPKSRAGKRSLTFPAQPGSVTPTRFRRRCGPRVAHVPRARHRSPSWPAHLATDLRFRIGAGEGNRILMTSLEG
jgi:hypothetical protein